MASETRFHYNQLLDRIARELDISPTDYKLAVQRYTAVGDWLQTGEYDGCEGVAHIYPQGSFNLGTVVRPIRDGKEASYDIDLVCNAGFTFGIPLCNRLDKWIYCLKFCLACFGWLFVRSVAELSRAIYRRNGFAICWVSDNIYSNSSIFDFGYGDFFVELRSQCDLH